ncbi:MAG: hypothetical protein AAF125_12160 [Chloroflexota bacterium]
MIRANVDPNEPGWMDEGFSTFTEWYLGSDDLTFVDIFLANPNLQLNTWTEDGNRIADYGAAQLWVTYLYERFGVEGLRVLSADPADGFFAVDNLAEAYGTDANTLFADWTVANYLRDPARTGIDAYGYTQLQDFQNVAIRPLDRLPADEVFTVRQYAAEYVQVVVPRGTTGVRLTVDAPSVVPLADTVSPTATPMWYSNRGDSSDTTLTFPLDLTANTTPTLSYDLWYHIENLWDYGYLMASVDGGRTWDVLKTAGMTTENPFFTAYGPGYTGRSGGWSTETVDLSPYVGQSILMRFEMIYDDAINQPGMLVDSITLTDTATGEKRTDDFGGTGDWNLDFETAGWVLTDNRLPQSVWVQAIQESGVAATVSRWQHTGGEATYAVPLNPGVERLTVVLAPFAPTTTVSTDIRLGIAVE